MTPLSPAELAEIRGRSRLHDDLIESFQPSLSPAQKDRRALLRHIDAIAADAARGAHADAMKLYAALKLVRPNHPLVDALRQSYCEIWRSGSGAGQCALASQLAVGEGS